jgi:osmoprotectant transport system substrate-binding protein
MRTWPARALIVAAAVALFAGCGSSSQPPSQTALHLDDDVITVGSFDFAESRTLAEVYSQGLEAAGYKVHRAFGLGPREFVGSALSTGLVEFVPEYAGTAAEFYSLGRAEPTDDVATTHTELVSALDGQHVVALDPAPAEDANAFVVTHATATRLGLEKLSDLQPVAGRLTFGGPPECPTRQLCLVGLSDTYGLEFGNLVTVDAGGPLTRHALSEGLVDVALMFTTDPGIEAEGLVELEDDRGLQPAESVTPLIRTELVDRMGPGLVDAINSVSALLTTGVVRDLNGATGAAGEDSARVVAHWWSENQP